MHRRLSTLVKNSTRDRNQEGADDGFDHESKVSTIVHDEPLPAPSLKVKRVDYYYSRWGKSWKYRVSVLLNMSPGFSFLSTISEHEFKGNGRDHPDSPSRKQRSLEGF
jgi:hypothetical protein